MSKYVVDIQSGTVLDINFCRIVDTEDLSPEQLENFGDSDAETIDIAKIYGGKIKDQ